VNQIVRQSWVITPGELLPLMEARLPQSALDMSQHTDLSLVREGAGRIP
jgi:hypothetical protein